MKTLPLKDLEDCLVKFTKQRYYTEGRKLESLQKSAYKLGGNV